MTHTLSALQPRNVDMLLLSSSISKEFVKHFGKCQGWQMAEQRQITVCGQALPMQPTSFHTCSPNHERKKSVLSKKVFFRETGSSADTTLSTWAASWQTHNLHFFPFSSIRLCVSNEMFKEIIKRAHGTRAYLAEV